jgi:L-threonylcarbamoyladenylate synthase
VPVLQSSANPAGGSDPAGPEEIVPQIAAGVDLILDAGRLGGVASTVVDLARYESDGQYSILREGALTRERVGALLGND